MGSRSGVTDPEVQTVAMAAVGERDISTRRLRLHMFVLLIHFVLLIAN